MSGDVKALFWEVAEPFLADGADESTMMGHPLTEEPPSGNANPTGSNNGQRVLNRLLVAGANRRLLDRPGA